MAAKKATERLALLERVVAEVMTATLVTRVPEPAAFTYELKWDGYRIVALKAGAAVRLVSRKKQDYTRAFPAVARDVAALAPGECALDGEVCALDPRGIPSFQLLQRHARGRAPLVFFVFDCLWVDGDDLRGRPIEERRARLAEIVDDAARRGSLVLSTSSEGDPSAILALACERGLEGIVAKRRGSKYSPGRGAAWLKLKCRLRQELAIVGYLPLRQGEDAIGGLLLAVKRGDHFRYAGKVGTGFDDATRVRLAELLDRDRVHAPPAEGLPRFGGIARYVAPRWVAEVAFTEWTEGGHVRHASFQGLRTDKSPDECVRERPVAAFEVATSERPRVLGVALSNPRRVLGPTGLTKLELARYYEAVGEHMLPHVAGRPLTLVRWAEGKATEKGGVYLRHARAWGPDVLRRVRIPERTKVGEYLVAETVEALVGLAQMDILEIHTWSSTTRDLEHPDRLVFDLDPAPGVAWAEVVRAARLVRERLADLDLESWVKTTGGKGLHVVAPLEPEATWDECLGFARAFARLLSREEPKRFVDAVSKQTRRGKILVDYLRNNRTNTSVAAFSTRARPRAPVSVPVAWEELDAISGSDAWDTTTVRERLAGERVGPWARYFRTSQRLPRR